MNKIKWSIFNGILDYSTGVEIMYDNIKNLINRNNVYDGVIMILEYNKVFTKGISKINYNEILENNLTILESKRGGGLTYHGPGQTIIYPLINLCYFNNNINEYIEFLHQWIISSLKRVGIDSYKHDLGIGVWATKNNLPHKIGFIGLRVKQNITHYGIGINISPDLKEFKKIIGCGIVSNNITSILDLGYSINRDDFNNILKQEFYNIYG